MSRNRLGGGEVLLIGLRVDGCRSALAGLNSRKAAIKHDKPTTCMRIYGRTCVCVCQIWVAISVGCLDFIAIYLC